MSRVINSTAFLTLPTEIAFGFIFDLQSGKNEYLALEQTVVQKFKWLTLKFRIKNILLVAENKTRGLSFLQVNGLQKFRKQWY